MRGEIAVNWGGQTNPTFRVYDSLGRLEELRTSQIFAHPLRLCGEKFINRRINTKSRHGFWLAYGKARGQIRGK